MKVEKWISKNIDTHNFEHKNVFITGGNSGIGFELAKHCVRLNANVFILCRNEEKALNAIDEIKKEKADANVSFIKLDLADFSSIEKASQEIKKYDVDFFVNNAGVFRLPYSKTKDGFEIVMGTNYLGTLYLTYTLMPYFVKLTHPVHINFVSSITSKLSKIHYNDFFMEKRYVPMKIYERSKIAINNLYKFLCEKYNDSNIIFSLSHPGGTYSPLIKKAYRVKAFQAVAKCFMKIVMHSPKKACLSMLYALNYDSNIVVGPRGLFQLSGYPRKTKLPYDKNFIKCVEMGMDYINSRKEKVA